MRQFRTIHLKRNPGNSTESFGVVKNFIRYIFNAADEQCAFRSELSFEPASCHGRPPAFFSNLRHRRSIARIKFIQCLPGIFRYMTERVHSNFQLFGRKARPLSRLAIKVNQWAESACLAANDSDHKWEPKGTGADEGFRGAPHTLPNWEWILQRSWIDRQVVKWRAEFTPPGNKFVITNLEQEFEFFCKKFIIILQAIPKER